MVGYEGVGSLQLDQLVGASLGSRFVQYDESDVILYALAVGAHASDLDLVFERDLRVLPTFATTLGLWANDEVAALGVFTPDAALHGAQTLEMIEPLPRTGGFEVSASVTGVWDKGRSAVVDVTATSAYFRTTYSIFLPGRGGWGGTQGAATSTSTNPMPGGAGDWRGEPSWSTRFATSPEQAALYRLTGDRHLIHIDPGAAVSAGLPGVILHGLCTLGIAAREVSAAAGAHPADLRHVSARFAAPLLPGEVLRIYGCKPEKGEVLFTGSSDETTVLSAGHARFDASQRESPSHRSASWSTHA